jgi:hypothetical protein
MNTCEATMTIADDYGDNEATIHCQLEAGHAGPHEEKFERDDCGSVCIQWTGEK